MCYKKFTLCQNCLQGILTTLPMGNVSLNSQMPAHAAVRGGWKGKVTFTKQYTCTQLGA